MSHDTQRLNAWGQPLPPALARPPRILQRASPSAPQDRVGHPLTSTQRGGAARGRTRPPPSSSPSPSPSPSSSSSSRGRSRPSSAQESSAPPARPRGGRGGSRGLRGGREEREEQASPSLFDVITSHTQRRHHATTAKRGSKQNKQSKQSFDPLAYIAATREAQAKQRRAAQQQANPNHASAVATVKLRGKERETPKSKKPTKLKQAILADRETFHASEEDALLSSSSSSSLSLPSFSPSLSGSPREARSDQATETGPQASGGDGSSAPHDPPHDPPHDSLHGPEEERDDQEDQEMPLDRASLAASPRVPLHLPSPSSGLPDTTQAPTLGGEEDEPSSSSPLDVPPTIHLGDASPSTVVPSPGVGDVPRIPPRCTVREYCDGVISPELNASVSSLISQLYAYQLRAQQRDARKAKKRVVLGVREVQRSVQRRKSLCLIVTYNIERTASLDQLTRELIDSARQQAIPVVFALKKADLAKAIGKRMHMAFASIVNVDGVHEAFRAMLQLAAAMRDEKRLIDEWLVAEQRNEVGDPVGTPYSKHPLLNPTTGVLSDCYRYLIQRYPQRPWHVVPLSPSPPSPSSE